MATREQSVRARQGAAVRLRDALVGICNCDGRPKPDRGRCCCMTLPEDQPVEKPDLAIYSQLEQLQAGSPPSWDSPHITTNHWRPFRLMTEARVVVRNLSTTTSAANALVHFYVAPFGIGTPRQLLQSRVVSLPKSSQAELLFPFDQATLAGDPRVGVHVQIEHPHDLKLINNRGSQVHDGSYTTEVGRTQTLSIPVVNDSNFSRQILLSVLPTDVVASVTPTNHTFAPHEQMIARLEMEIPSFLTGSPGSPIHRSVTVVGRLASGELVGGATKLWRIDD